MEEERKARIDANGQLTLPKCVMDELGLIGGEGFIVATDGKDIKLRRLRRLKRIGEEENTLHRFLLGVSPPTSMEQ
ncbi:MAG: hypothetical protein M1530_01105 [Candidatus Marsarchaeota archaeon]|nr:hypothetical protein [Candidatus Marsarchaeota archaeon]